MNLRIAVIGGGAAGMMAAVAAAEAGSGEPKAAQVTLFEKNTYLGAKVIISGGGRCNVTTGVHDVQRLLENYPRGAKFLMSALYRFPPQAVMAWFEQHGVPLKTEEDLRVFPVSNEGKDVAGALEHELRQLGVELRLGSQVTGVSVTADQRATAQSVSLTSQKKSGGEPLFLVHEKNGTVTEFDRVIVTTGGNAYRHTGSTGDGYAFAAGLGHTITPLGPSLNSFTVAEPWIREVAGVSLEKVGLRLVAGTSEALAVGTAPKRLATKPYTRTGPLVFTHKGVSGPAVFALSALSAYEPCAPDRPLSLFLDFFPDESPQSLSDRIDRTIDEHSKKVVVNCIDFFLPRSLCAPFLDLLEVTRTLHAAQLSRKQRTHLRDLLKAFPLTVIGRSAGEEFVTAGGVELKEVNTNTMESRICRGLFFAGEILDIDGFTGGFNLQASWATGRLAGEQAGL